MKFSSMLVFSIGWLLAVYCPLAHMVWGKGGFLNVSGGAIPTLDFAGGVVVHISSGVSALVCALVLGALVLNELTSGRGRSATSARSA